MSRLRRAAPLALFLGSATLGLAVPQLLRGTAPAGPSRAVVMAAAPERGNSCGPGLGASAATKRLFVGRVYNLDLAASEIGGESDPEGMAGLIGGLEQIRLPNPPGEEESIFDIETMMQTVRLEFGYSTLGRRVCLQDKSATTRTEKWCDASTPASPFVVRIAGWQDMRWKNDGALAWPFGCGSFCYKIGGSCVDPIGPRVSTTMLPGAGMPVASRMVENAGEARMLADRMYGASGDVSGDINSAMAYQDYDLVLGGFVDHQVDTVMVSGTRSERRQLSLGLVGYLHRRTYNDARVGLLPDSAGGLHVGARVVFRGPVSTSTRPLGLPPTGGFVSLATQARSFCGVGAVPNPNADWGCSRIPPAPRGWRDGVDYVAGGDDSTRMADNCKRQLEMIRRRAGAGLESFGEADCSSEANPTAQRMSDDDETLRQIGSDTLTPGNRKSDTLSFGQQKQTGRGGRVTDRGDTLNVSSEWRRQCRLVWQRDSARVVNRGWDAGPAAARYRECLARGGEGG